MDFLSLSFLKQPESSLNFLKPESFVWKQYINGQPAFTEQGMYKLMPSLTCSIDNNLKNWIHMANENELTSLLKF